MARSILGFAAAAVLLSASASAQTYVTFTVPNADATAATGINDDGVVAGYILVGGAGLHAFVRATDGTITRFDPQGALSSIPTGIDKHGTIAGTWQDGNFAQHGFVRGGDGTLTTFDPPNSAITFVTAVHGKTVGYFSDTAHDDHVRAFALTPAGHLRLFGCQGARYTFAAALNSRGAVAGSWTRRIAHAHTPEHGFVRGADGVCATFDAPGAVQTVVSGINTSGTVTGYFHVAREGEVEHGFVRAPDGTITPFDIPGAKSTKPVAINAAGTIAGTYRNNARRTHGFVRAADGTLTSFDPPDAEGTSVYAINDGGAIVGHYLSKTGSQPAFIRLP